MTSGKHPPSEEQRAEAVAKTFLNGLFVEQFKIQKWPHEALNMPSYVALFSVKLSHAFHTHTDRSVFFELLLAKFTEHGQIS